MLLAEFRARVLASLIPPPKLALSAWIEANIVLPSGTTALPGRVKMWPYMRAVADAITDPTIERVSFVKPTRVGYTTLLTGAISNFIANEPASALPQGRVRTADAAASARRRPR
jgi:phage terminase large subunit GpA-like protein